MEKASNSNKSTKFSKMLQRALSIGHSAAPFSPGRDFHHSRTASTVHRGIFFSSPLVPTAARVRRSTKNEGVLAEPTSPKVSCIGQVKLNKPKCSSERKNKATNKLKTASSLSSCAIKEEENRRSFSKLKRLFSTLSFSSKKSNSTAFATAAVEEPVVAVAPSLGKMKKFASSRGALGGFDWTVEMKRQESQSDHQDVTIPYSQSMPLTQLEGLSLCPKPKSEVNLWKRRTMDRPKPLQVKVTS
ncbi:hypothetical protein CARUB_v10010139mg [Capsella rubella]|uniref:Uncharacterized protein n=1 Tax=Capsella rubella TaxID=81985 RepID=R0IDC9_9BRAS|nr:uncharacterized protein At1g76070 [Capsella rubella]EOA36215.1 hypothetical protein CARUB_v10010139mg [Capsella rubella]